MNAKSCAKSCWWAPLGGPDTLQDALAENERLRAKIDASIRILTDDRLPIQSRVNDVRGVLAR